MIDQFSAKTNGKKLVLKVNGPMVIIGEDNGSNMFKVIDMAFGSWQLIMQDLKNSGYQVELVK